MAIFEGVGVALVTLFDHNGDVDLAATVTHAERLIDVGLRSVVVAGSTGEAAALTPGERDALLSAVVAAVGNRAAVLAGTGAPSARQAADLTKRAVASGAHGLLTLSPPGTADPRAYYDRVASAAGDTPVLAYHFPAVSSPGIAVDALASLPVVGVKDSSGDPDRLLATLEAWDGAIYVGSAALLSMAGPLGCTGAILALANAEPELCIAAFKGDAGAQRALTPSHLESKRSFPGSIKALTAKRYGTSPVARMG